MIDSDTRNRLSEAQALAVDVLTYVSRMCGTAADALYREGREDDADAIGAIGTLAPFIASNIAHPRDHT